ncbi:CUE domain-containing protein 1 isoform X2 [Lemur catta]|uniref:CUE domain-containing protein 1 isoform X2 n=1 Tax=Lemur catta TaxID=9447 RepID=UPI001E26E837|nr:CUE domain-containing protein 1 isoform X2 [Lemur catta]
MKSPRLCTPHQPTTCTCLTGLTLWLPPRHLPGSTRWAPDLLRARGAIGTGTHHCWATSPMTFSASCPSSWTAYRERTLNRTPHFRSARRFPVLPREGGSLGRFSPAGAPQAGGRWAWGSQWQRAKGNPGGPKPVSREGGPPATAGPGPPDQESRWKQYLEDERIALFLQNEEFMKELQRNRDFLLALERDRLKYESQKSKSSTVAVGNDFSFPSPVPGTGDANPAVSEDALFRDKLKHMGKSTRRKLFELARAFSEKTKMRKSKRKHLLKHQSLGAAASTANLLDDVEGHACDEDFRGRRQETPKVEEALREGQ